MSFFDVLSIPHTTETLDFPDESVERRVFKAEDLYPAIIGRIVEVIEGDEPSELLATAKAGGTARADRLVSNALALPPEAWKDALKPRDEFVSVPYSSLVERNGRLVGSLLDAFPKEMQEDVLRMVNRGYALEIALGWFSHALRLAVGTNYNRVSSAPEKPFRL